MRERGAAMSGDALRFARLRERELVAVLLEEAGV